MLSDLPNIFQWWITFFIIGIIFTPITNLIFSSFFDKGYVFAKVIGIALISYCVYILGFFKILSFETNNVFLIIGIFILINFFLKKKFPRSNFKFKPILTILLIEEAMLILIILLWSFIHGNQPEIHGLEKYMDYGFINSILRSDYFPPLDMWFTPFYINYYYFGHLVTAVLTKISFIPSSITFNLMLSTISALSFVSAFSIGLNLLSKINARRYMLYAGGLLTAFILNFTGNLHAIYLFFKPYENENPVPFWQLVFSPLTFPNNYWYPNATRFIENTIHEFPLYSYVVSDLHGHVLDIPFVLLTIALLLSIFLKQKQAVFELKTQNSNLKTATQNSKLFSFKLMPLSFELCTLSFFLAIMYMTNAWDGLIYLLLAVIIIFITRLKSGNKKYILHTTYYILLILVGFFLFSLPFNLNFKPFASGVGILCAPTFLTDIGKLGPFLFEKDHCQHSPWWQIFILYGFFYFWVFSFIVFLKLNAKRYTLNASDIFIVILIILSTIILIIPELIYVKDIYPAHYRANTMFKLAYQSFIMLSLASGYIIIRSVLSIKYYVLSSNIKILATFYILLTTIFFILISLYPYFAINSYFGNLQKYSGLDGTKYLKPLYPTDYEAILWINQNIKGQPIILEAQGDSYTDYARISTNTGLPTVLGWTVHEWLWRGTYDIPSPRIEEIKNLYESKDLQLTKDLIGKYKIKLVFVGDLERQKYTDFDEEKFRSLGKIIYEQGDTKIFKLNN